MNSPIVAGNARNSKTLSRAVTRGALRPLALNLYSADLITPASQLIRSHWQEVLCALVPEAVVSFRTALDGAPASDGSVFLSGPSRYERELPGLRIRVTRGMGHLPGDNVNGGVRSASFARALLDAARPTRKRTAVARGLDETALEQRIRLAGPAGETDWYAQLHRQLADLARVLGAERELVLLTRILNRLTSNEVDWTAALVESAAQAAAQCLFPEATPGVFTDDAMRDARASVALDGFIVSERDARAAIDNQAVQGDEQAAIALQQTYALVGRRVFMARGIADGETIDELADRIVQWTSIAGGSPPDADTLSSIGRGLRLLIAIEHPLARALGVHALIVMSAGEQSAGRVARAFMSAELASCGLPRVIIPAEQQREYSAAASSRDFEKLNGICISAIRSAR